MKGTRATKSVVLGVAAALAYCALGGEAPDAASEPGDDAVETAPAEQAAEEQAAVQPGHLFVAARLLHFELVALRYVLGGSSARDSGATPEVVAASTRHVFNQAQVLFMKTNQLGEEVAGDRALPLEAVNADWRRTRARPAPTGRDIVPADAQRVIVDSHDRVRALLRLRNVNVSLQDPPPLDLSMRSADVLGEILRIKRQLNRMLAREFPMRNVYDLILQAVNYAGDLGAGYPPFARSPQEMTPLDVYQRLVANFDLVRDIGSQAGAQVIDMRFESEPDEDDITPSDIYDFAAMLHGELVYLAERQGAEHTRLPRGEYTMPRDVLPWHVFQLIDVLETQLRNLQPQDAAEATNGEAEETE